MKSCQSEIWSNYTSHAHDYMQAQQLRHVYIHVSVSNYKTCIRAGSKVAICAVCGAKLC